MKELILFAVLIALAQNIRANEKDEPKEGPCKKMMDAWKSADFAKGNHMLKRGLFKDCMQPLLSGQAVAGVSVAPDVVAACKKIKEAKKTK